MITVSDLSLQFNKRVLFDEVNLKFTPGNCYGVIGANGAGKSTFIKILSGVMDPTKGKVSITPGDRLSVLSQNHNEFDDYTVLDTIIMGNKDLYKIMKEKDAIYAKPDFDEKDGEIAAELESKFAEMDGWNAETDAASLLSNLGVAEEFHYKQMADLEGNLKVRILLAQALFGTPEILLLDEPTNHLDVKTINWLENFLGNYPNTVIVVSHDRHFLDSVCTDIVDIDRQKITTYSGNYTFWYESSQLASRQAAQQNKKAEEKKKELQEFISRFSANASKSKQTTSRKKMLEKLNVDAIQPSSRRYPAIIFNQEREAGDQILHIENLSQSLEGEKLFSNFEMNVQGGDKVAFLSRNPKAVTSLFDIIGDGVEPETGSLAWGQTIKPAYVPSENDKYFTKDESLIDWLREYTNETDEVFVRGYLGKMLFSGEEAMKSAKVLSGGEKVRCMVSRAMLQEPNFIILDEPTAHLDLESITAYNNSLIDYKGTVFFMSQDHQFVQTVANRIVEIGPKGIINKEMTYDDYLAHPKLEEWRSAIY